MTETEYHYTSDLDLASALIAVGFPMTNIEFRQNHAEIIFHKTRGLEDAMEDYYNMEMKVQPQLLFSSKKLIRSRINDLTNNYEQ